MSDSIPTVVVDAAALAELAKRICCVEKRVTTNEETIVTIQETPPTCEGDCTCENCECESCEGCEGEGCGNCDDCAPDPKTCDFECTNLAFFGDAGEAIDNKQQELYDRLVTRDPDIVLMAGDNTYTNPANCADIELDHLRFKPYRDREILLPAIGNHDLDVDADNLCAASLYTYLPGNKRYYTMKFPESGVQVFVLNTGQNTAGAQLEPDGNAIDEEQYRWFLEEVSKSTAKWKIVMFHHPWFSQQSAAASGSQYLPQLDWNFQAAGIDIVVNGHNHMSVHHSWDGVEYVQASLSVRPARDKRADDTQTYGLPHGGLVWIDDRNGLTGDPAVGFIEITRDALKVEFVDTITGEVLHSFTKTNDRDFDCEALEVPCPCSHISYSSF